MSRTTAAVSAELARFVGPAYGAMDPLYGGMGAAFAASEAAAESLAGVLSIEGAEGKWLDLLGRGYGQRRAADEDDDAYRIRLRTPPGGVTRAGILDAVNALLTEYGAADAVMEEWWETGYLDHSLYLDYHNFNDPRNRFLLILPLIGDVDGAASYFDVVYLDHDAYMGTSLNWAPYLAIIKLVGALKAAGVKWGIYINADGDFHG